MYLKLLRLFFLRFGHDDNRDVSRFPVGQNVYQSSRTRDQELMETVRESVMGLTGWYSEVKDFGNNGVDQYE